MTCNTMLTVLATSAALGVLCTTALADKDIGDHRSQGGYVVPCSLDGVNPAYHPDVFGSPAMARSYGFYLGADHAWHVVPGCRAR
jgi:hypothetical protein